MQKKFSNLKTVFNNYHNSKIKIFMKNRLLFQCLILIIIFSCSSTSVFAQEKQFVKNCVTDGFYVKKSVFRLDKNKNLVMGLLTQNTNYLVYSRTNPIRIFLMAGNALDIFSWISTDDACPSEECPWCGYIKNGTIASDQSFFVEGGRQLVFPKGTDLSFTLDKKNRDKCVVYSAYNPTKGISIDGTVYKNQRIYFYEDGTISK
jgi:hypothetical protein